MDVLEEADLYLSGLSLRAVASKVGKSHVSVWEDLIGGKLEKLNPDKYGEVLKQIDKNSPDSIKKDDVRKRVLEVYDLLVNKDLKVNEIASIYNVGVSVINRDLTIRLKLLNMVDNTIVTDEMLANVADTLARHSMENSPYIKR